MDENEKTITRAAAISYDPKEHDVPVLAAFGEGYLARRIVEVAHESGIPILQDRGLSSILSKISVGDEISPELYEAVAKVLAFVGEIDRSYAEKIDRGFIREQHKHS
jgi:flagellar biosynthesis protein